MKNRDVLFLRKDNIWVVPIIHYNMEMAAQVKSAFEILKPDCVAVELAETMQLKLLHAASRLPDISVVVAYDQKQQPIYYLCEPCDGTFEGLRCALESQTAAYCIDLDVDDYPNVRENVPDPYAIQRIGLKNYYEIYQQATSENRAASTDIDHKREMHMAKRLKELSLSYERVLFVCGMAHAAKILGLVERRSFPVYSHAKREVVELCALTDESTREVMAEYGWMSMQYEIARQQMVDFPPDRQKIIFNLIKEAAKKYTDHTSNPFPGYHMRNIMKFLRNYALTTSKLMPNLYQILSAAKGCVDHNFAYEVWELATAYPLRRNVDNLPVLDLSVEEIWGHSKIIRFHLKEHARKNHFVQRLRKGKAQYRFQPPGPFSICSFPPEDVVVENFGDFLKKKGVQVMTEDAARTIPFSTSLEDGIDTKETIRHWHEKKLYVKAKGKPPGGVGSVVIVFDEDLPEEGKPYHEKFPWHTTWLGEHTQESDMAFYATPMTEKIIGPGISRCEYGGFMMSYPPRRMYDIWSDPDYQNCRTKADVLLMAAIDYAVKPVIVYVAAKPPKSILKSFANRFGKKIVYIPIGQLSPVTLNKLRNFHVLDGHNRRDIAGEYIY